MIAIKNETSELFSAFIYFNRSVNSDSRFVDEGQQFPWCEKMIVFFFFPPISQNSESLDVIPGLHRNINDFNEEKLGGKQLLPKWPALYFFKKSYYHK